MEDLLHLASPDGSDDAQWFFCTVHVLTELSGSPVLRRATFALAEAVRTFLQKTFVISSAGIEAPPSSLPLVDDVVIGDEPVNFELLST